MVGEEPGVLVEHGEGAPQRRGRETPGRVDALAEVAGVPAVPGAVYFVIGNDKQMAAYEAYLKSAVSPAAVLHRLYPRDFWPEPAAVMQ